MKVPAARPSARKIPWPETSDVILDLSDDENDD